MKSTRARKCRGHGADHGKVWLLYSGDFVFFLALLAEGADISLDIVCSWFSCKIQGTTVLTISFQSPRSFCELGLSHTRACKTQVASLRQPPLGIVSTDILLKFPALGSAQMAMGHDPCLHGADEHPCTTFDVHQGCRVLTHNHRCPFWLFWSKHGWRSLGFPVVFSHLPGKPHLFPT